MRTLRISGLSLILVCAGVWPVLAQPGSGRYEVSGQASLLRLSDFDATTVGLGGRVIVDVSRWLAIDAEGQFFPSDDILIRARGVPDVDFAVAHRRQRADGFFGVKVGARRDRMGLFARVRPGFTRLIDQGVECVGVDCARRRGSRRRLRG